jgi:glycosyltransferase involved in cell wall biosynthesis
MTLAVVSESLRRDNHKPLQWFTKFKVVHFYEKAPYGDITKDELRSARRYEDTRDLVAQLVALRPDLIQGTEPYASRNSLRIAYSVWRMAKELGIPYFFPMLENRLPSDRFGPAVGIAMEQFLRFYAKNAALVFAHNNGAVENLHRAGVPDEKIVRLLWGIWGVDTKEFTPAGSKAKLPKPNILFVGRLDSEKGILYLLRAFAILRPKFRKLHLIVIGPGKLSSQITGERVKYLGPIPNKDLPKYFRAATVVAYPSYTTERKDKEAGIRGWAEQVGTVNLQGMATGKPVVSTFCGAIPEFVPEGKAGILVAEKDAVGLANAVETLLLKTPLAKRMGAYGRKHVVSNFDSKKTVEEAQRILLKRLNLTKS